MIAFECPKFGNLPAPRRPHTKVAAKLAERPGTWAAIGIQNTHTGIDRKRLQNRFGLEVRRVDNGDGTSTVWARVQPFRIEAPSEQAMPATPRIVPRHTRWVWGQIIEVAA